MRQILHLLLFDRNRGTCLAAHFGSRWLLPVLTCGERVRADRHALRWAGGRGIEADVAGQWLGRIASDGVDWLMVLTVRPDGETPDPQLRWTPVDRLPPASALLDYQGWALARSLARGDEPSVPGPFGCVGWPAHVKAWIERVTGSSCGRPVPYRTSAHEVVLGACTESGRVFFKGLTAERGIEATLTERLALLEPGRFARTLALEPRQNGAVWWLAEGCPGRPAIETEAVARDLAEVQQSLRATARGLCGLRTLDIEATTRWCATLAGPNTAGAMERGLDLVAHAAVPWSWIPMDLDPVNVLIDDDGAVRFIDLDDSFLGPAPLALALFAKRSRSGSAYRAYENAWSPPLRGIHWPEFETAAAIVEARLGWQRVERNVRRGELHGDIAGVQPRIHERLLKMLQRL